MPLARALAFVLALTPAHAIAQLAIGASSEFALDRGGPQQSDHGYMHGYSVGFLMDVPTDSAWRWTMGLSLANKTYTSINQFLASFTPLRSVTLSYAEIAVTPAWLLRWKSLDIGITVGCRGSLFIDADAFVPGRSDEQYLLSDRVADSTNPFEFALLYGFDLTWHTSDAAAVRLGYSSQHGLNEIFNVPSCPDCNFRLREERLLLGLILVPQW